MSLTDKQCDDIREKVYGVAHATPTDLHNALLREAFARGMAERPPGMTLEKEPRMVMFRDYRSGDAVCVPYRDDETYRDRNPYARIECYLYAKETK